MDAAQKEPPKRPEIIASLNELAKERESQGYARGRNAGYWDGYDTGYSDASAPHGALPIVVGIVVGILLSWGCWALFK